MTPWSLTVWNVWCWGFTVPQRFQYGIWPKNNNLPLRRLRETVSRCFSDYLCCLEGLCCNRCVAHSWLELIYCTDFQFLFFCGDESFACLNIQADNLKKKKKKRLFFLCWVFYQSSDLFHLLASRPQLSPSAGYIIERMPNLQTAGSTLRLLPAAKTSCLDFLLKSVLCWTFHVLEKWQKGVSE